MMNCFGRGAVFVLALTSIFMSSETSSNLNSKRSFLEQPGCPLVSVKSEGSAVVLKNVSSKDIITYRLACFVQHGKQLKRILLFEKSEDGTVQPGKTFIEGGFDATPVNVCRSRKSQLGVAEVEFKDLTVWKSPIDDK